jgi:uncharacterized membrane protein
MVVQGALVRTTIAYSEGQHAGFGLSCATGLRMVLPMIGLTIITALGLSAATLLLLIPGIMLFLMWCVATPALVAERCGIFGSLGRSRYLTKGARWKIFGLYLMIMVVFWLILIGFILIVGVAGLASMGQHPSVASAAINAILNTLLLAFLATLSSSLFVELRNWKEGAAPDQLADVFA